MMRRVRVLVSGGVMVLVGAVGGCSDAAPRPVVTPSIVWNGDPARGELENDPWVGALRDGTVAIAAATNAANYADETLTTSWHDSLVRRAASRASRDIDEGTAYVALGPRPITPVHVVEEDETAATVWACDEQIPVRGLESSNIESQVGATLYGLQLGDDGHRRLTGSRPAMEGDVLPDGQQFDDEYCLSVPIARGLFDPAPKLDVLLELDGDDVIAPPAPSPTFAVEVPR